MKHFKIRTEGGRGFAPKPVIKKLAASLLNCVVGVQNGKGLSRVGHWKGY
ncbi:hypothetical protein D349_02735 [Enterococcus faecalis UP2S-6]|nr:hypothetical protein D349_02735 [Enterococcus faecalis UP2S-6]